MMWWSRAYVKHLHEEIDWLRLQWAKSNQRAEDAVSAMLALKTHGQVALPPRPLIADREKDIAQDVERLFADSEFAGAGT